MTGAETSNCLPGAPSVNTCSAIFSSGLEKTALQDEVFKHHPLGGCENVSVSKFSPAPVDGEETLTKLIMHPIHIDLATGQISPMAFQDATTLDLSLFREGLASDGEIQLAINQIRETGAGRIPPQDRVLNGVLQATAASIRALVFDDDGGRMCFLYDTGEKDKPHHASVFTPTRARKGSSQRQVRKKLYDLFMKTPIQLPNYRKLEF